MPFVEQRSFAPVRQRVVVGTAQTAPLDRRMSFQQSSGSPRVVARSSSAISLQAFKSQPIQRCQSINQAAIRQVSPVRIRSPSSCPPQQESAYEKAAIRQVSPVRIRSPSSSPPQQAAAALRSTSPLPSLLGAGSGHHIVRRHSFCEKTLAQPSKSVLSSCSESLRTGDVVTISSQEFQVEERLGQGSFGCVWAASSLSYADKVAIKEIACKTQNELQEAEAEAHRLRSLSFSGVQQVPALLAAQTQRTGPKSWRLLVAMQRIPGEALDKFCSKQKLICDEIQLDLQVRLVQVCRFAGSMLWQIAEIFKGVSPHMFHRDAHLRNMLVADGRGARPKFGLIDFGLAVDASSWKRGDWQNKTIGGDCRYWPASAWIMFSNGTQDLCKRPQLRQEYETRLDLHSIGLSGLQLLAEMIEPHINFMPRQAVLSSPLLLKLRKLHAGWQKYWTDSTRFWREVLDAFQGKRQMSDVRAHCKSICVADLFVRNLNELKASLRELREVCRDSIAITEVIDSLLRLISSGDGSTAASWEQIQSFVQSHAGDANVSECADMSVKRLFTVPSTKASSADVSPEASLQSTVAPQSTGGTVSPTTTPPAPASDVAFSLPRQTSGERVIMA